MWLPSYRHLLSTNDGGVILRTLTSSEGYQFSQERERESARERKRERKGKRERESMEGESVCAREWREEVCERGSGGRERVCERERERREEVCVRGRETERVCVRERVEGESV